LGAGFGGPRAAKDDSEGGGESSAPDAKAIIEHRALGRRR